MTTANKITMVRIFLIPFFLFFAIRFNDTVALMLFIVASLTDFLDGYIARKYNQVTDFGKFVDPLADKLMVCAALVVFIERGQMGAVPVFIILAREFIITSLRIVAIGKGRVLAATWTGKVKTCVQIGGTILLFLCSIIFNNSGSTVNNVQNIAVWAMTIVTVYSGFDYLYKNWDIVADGATKSK